MHTHALVAPVAPTSDGGLTPRSANAPTIANASTEARPEGTPPAPAASLAEAVAHHRVLRGGARGEIVLPALGRVSVVAKRSTERVDVRVRADEADTARTLAAAAREMGAHVRVAVPEARISVDDSRPSRGSQTHTPANGDRSPDRGEARDSSAEEGSRDDALARSAAAPRARARIVL